MERGKEGVGRVHDPGLNCRQIRLLAGTIAVALLAALATAALGPLLLVFIRMKRVVCVFRAAAIFVASGLFVPALALAQDDSPSRPQTESWRTRLQGGIGFVRVEPVGEFSTFVPEAAPGVLLHVDYGLGQTLFRVGGEFAWAQYGQTTRTVALGGLIPEVPDASLDVQTENALLMLHGRVRAQARRGRWKPYADGLIGFTSIYTRSEVRANESCDDGSCESTSDAFTHERDFVLSYGGGAGVMFRILPRPDAPSVDVSLRYIRGGIADYLVEGAVRVEGGQVTRDISRSRTDTVAFYIGVAFGR